MHFLKRPCVPALACLLALALAVACGPTAKDIARDKQGQPVKVARGSVTAKQFIPASTQIITSYTSYGPISMPVTTPASHRITFSFDGLSKTLNDQARFNAFEQGQAVEVSYVRGKSGTLYIQDITGVAPPKPPPVFNYVVKEDYFDAKKNIASAQTFRVYSDAGKLNIWSSATQRVFSPVSLDHTQNFMVEAEVAKSSPGSPDAGYGLAVGTDPGNCLVFVVSRNNKYAAAQFSGGQERMIKKWTPSSALKDGANTLAIARKDGVTSFLVNGQIVFDDPNALPPGGRVGFLLGQPMTLAVDNLRIHADDRLMPEEPDVVEEFVREPSPAARPSARAGKDPEAQLKLLLDAGLISPEEYQAKSTALKARQAPGPDPETASKIESLKTLREAGLLTEEEYQDKMRALTGEP